MADEYSFRFDGKHARGMGIVQQAPVYLSAPIPNVESTTVPGRNGELFKWDGSYENRTAQVSCFLLSGILDSEINAINAWLLGSQKYRRLEFEDDQNHFMLARATLGVEKQARVNLLNPFPLEFDCKPQRFLILGEDEIDVTSTLTIHNPTPYPAKPIIHVKGTGNIAISYGKGSVSAVGLAGDLYYDTETDKAYNANGSLDRIVYAAGDMSIPSGSVEILKYDQYATTGSYDYAIKVGETFSISYDEAGIDKFLGAVEIEGSGGLDWYDDGGVIEFMGTAPGVGTIRIHESDEVVGSFTFSVASTGTITYIGFVPRWWEL